MLDKQYEIAKNHGITKVEVYCGSWSKAKEYLSEHTKNEVIRDLKIGATTADRYYRKFRVQPIPECRICNTRNILEFDFDSWGRVNHGLCKICEKEFGPHRPKKERPPKKGEHLPIGRFTAEHSELDEYAWNMIRAKWGEGLPASYWIQEKDIETLYPG